MSIAGAAAVAVAPVTATTTRPTICAAGVMKNDPLPRRGSPLAVMRSELDHAPGPAPSCADRGLPALLEVPGFRSPGRHLGDRRPADREGAERPGGGLLDP